VPGRKVLNLVYCIEGKIIAIYFNIDAFKLQIVYSNEDFSMLKQNVF